MTLSRRRMLGTAASWLAVGCPGTATPTPTLAFVGPDPARGHLVREAALRELPAAEHRRARVVIVGAGVAGLSAAWRLHRAGEHDVVLVELEDEPGGTARGGELPRSRYPMGAHYLPAPQGFAALETLLDDLGLVVGRDREGRPEYDPRAICRAPVERHRHRGLWHEGLYPASGQDEGEAAELARFQAKLRELDRARGSDGRRLFELPVFRSSTDLRALDRITMAEWLAREGFGGWRVRWLVDYGCRDDYGCTAAQVSAFAGLHHFLARGLEDENGAGRLLLTWPDGNATLCTGIAARIELHERMLAGLAVIGIDPDEGKVRAYSPIDDRVLALDADVVLWAAPRFVLRHVLPPGRDPLAADTLGYTPWLVANVEVSKRPRGVGAPLAWDNVAVDAEHLGYVVANHLEPLDRRNEPGAVLTYYEPLVADDRDGLVRRRSELLGAGLPELAAHVTTQLVGMHAGIASDITAMHMCRWGHAMVRPVPGLLFGPELALAAAPIGRVLPCAADVGGLPLFEQAFTHGVLAAEQALARLGRSEAAMI